LRISRIGAVTGGLALATALVLTGCATDAPEEENGGGNSDAIILVNGVEPGGPLIPTNINETGGGKVIDNLFAGLVYYDADGKAINELAESIETDDAQNYTITVAEGWKFTNGEDVTAESFVNAWKYGALASNEQLNSYFFENIKGFSYEEDTELEGLQVTGDYEFTVELNAPQADYPLSLGYSAFFPLPSVAYDDIAAFGENPIGNGPYKLASEGAWQHDVQIDLVVNEEYEGGRKPANGGISIIFYASIDSAYADLLGGNLDVIDEIPAISLLTYKDDLGDRAISQPAAIFQSFTIPDRLAHFSGEEGQLRRAAISMSINRDEITEVIFSGTRTPATDFTSPVIDGWSDSVPGSEVLAYNPEEAVKLWAEADAISPWSGAFQIGYNADSSHKDWVDAVTNSITNTLGIEASGAPTPTFSEFRSSIVDRNIQTAFRTGWQADYPSLFNFLGPIYATDAGSNDGDYSSEEFDSLLADGSAAETPEEANEFFQQAQEVLFKDLPAIPLWYSDVQGGYSEAVSNVAIDWHSVPLYYAITKE